MNSDFNLNINPVQSAVQATLPHLFRSNGKILLTSEYFIMDGAPGIALPLKVGQEMRVSYKPNFEPHILVKSYNQNRELWFSAKYDIWQFRIVESSDAFRAELIQKIFKSCRKYNTHFLYESTNVILEHYLDFPYDWGLGSSSTLITNIARFARVNAFNILAETLGGSGFDLACATENGPILYTKINREANWSSLSLANWTFTNQLFFVYLGRKQSSQEGINYYRANVSESDKVAAKAFLMELTTAILNCTDLNEFIALLTKHEQFIAEKLKLPRVADLMFADFPGLVKSCGAWHGDFVLVATDKLNYSEVLNYFKQKNLNVVIPFNELVKLNQLQ